jgi:uncharacterized phage infection (PIP) family protein YhgE
MSEEMKLIINKLDKLEQGQIGLVNGQQKTEISLGKLEQGQIRLEQGQQKTEERLGRLEQGQTRLEQGQQKAEVRLGRLEQGQTRLEQGQQEMKDLMKHHMTLLTENITSIRMDLGRRVSDTESDVDLLFKEVESVKRRTNKLEKK